MREGLCRALTSRLHLPSRKPTSPKAQKQPGQIETLDLARHPALKSSLN
jgi:hypothetical protein